MQKVVTLVTLVTLYINGPQFLLQHGLQILLQGDMMVYVIQMRGTSHYKVGFTSGDVEKRRAQLQTASPVALDIVASVAGGRDLEIKVLRRWKNTSSAAMGEWLTLSKKQLGQMLRDDLGIEAQGLVIDGDLHPITLTFRQWLQQQEDRDDMIGDLARDAQRDAELPDDRAGQQKWLEHLELMGACAGAIEAFNRAWKEFTNLRKVSHA